MRDRHLLGKVTVLVMVVSPALAECPEGFTECILSGVTVEEIGCTPCCHDGPGSWAASGLCLGSLVIADNDLATVTGGWVLDTILTAQQSQAHIIGSNIGSWPTGPVSPGYRMWAEHESQLELSNALVARELWISDLATLKLSGATVHGSVMMVDNFGPVVYPKQPTVIMSGGTVDGSIEGYTVNINGGNMGGVSVLGVGATGIIGNATVVGNVGAGSGAVVAVSGGTLGGASATSATISVSNAEITGVAAVLGNGNGPTDVGTLTLNGGTVNDVFAQGANNNQALNGFAEISGAQVTQNLTAASGGSIRFLSGVVAQDATSAGSSFQLPGGYGSLVEIEDGLIMGNAQSQNKGELRVKGGVVGGNLTAANNSRILLSGGTVQGDLRTEGGARILQSGGGAAGEATIAGGLFWMTGGSVTKSTQVSNGAWLILDNGDLLGDVTISSFGSEVHGGTIGGNLNTSNASEVQITAGTVEGALIAKDSSKVTVEGGTFNLGAEAQGSSTIQASSGTISALSGIGGLALVAINGSTVKLSQTVVVAGKLAALDDSLIEMSGGSVLGGAILNQQANLVLSGVTSVIQDRVEIENSGILSMTGGTVNGILISRGSSTVFMNGGHITGRAEVQHTDPKASFNMEGGQIDGILFSYDSSKVTLSGGTVGGAEAWESGTLTINGGSINVDVKSFNNGTIELTGTPSIGFFLKAAGESTINASGGMVQLDATAAESAQLNLSGIVFIAGALRGYDQSHLTMSGGTVGGDLIVSNQVDMEMSGGLVEGAGLTQDSGYLDMSGGRINGRVESSNTGQEAGGIHISGGAVGGDFISRGFSDSLQGTGVVEGNLICSSSSRTDMLGGTVHRFAVGQQSGTLFIGSGAVGFDVEAQNESRVLLAGGSVGRDLIGRQSGRVYMDGGIVQRNLEGFNTSVITKTGGTVFGRIDPHDQCIMNISGGNTSGGQAFGGPDTQPLALALNITVEDSATIRFVGTALTTTLIDPNDQGLYSLYELTGTLADGTSVSGERFRVRNATGAQYKLVPFVPPDLDRDGDVDADDRVLLRACSTGPAIPYDPSHLPAGCMLTPDGDGKINADLDRDADVDQSDFGIFQRCWSGSGDPADPNCAS